MHFASYTLLPVLQVSLGPTCYDSLTSINSCVPLMLRALALFSFAPLSIVALSRLSLCHSTQFPFQTASFSLPLPLRLSQMSFSTPLPHPKHLPILPPFPPIPIPTSLFLLHPPTNPSPPCFSFLITIPIPFPGSGVRTDPCGPSALPPAPSSRHFSDFTQFAASLSNSFCSSSIILASLPPSSYPLSSTQVKEGGRSGSPLKLPA